MQWYNRTIFSPPSFCLQYHGLMMSWRLMFICSLNLSVNRIGCRRPNLFKTSQTCLRSRKHTCKSFLNLINYTYTIYNIVRSFIEGSDFKNTISDWPSTSARGSQTLQAILTKCSAVVPHLAAPWQRGAGGFEERKHPAGGHIGSYIWWVTRGGIVGWIWEGILMLKNPCIYICSV